MSFPIHGNPLHVRAPCVRVFYYAVSLVPVLYQHGHIQTVHTLFQEWLRAPALQKSMATDGPYVRTGSVWYKCCFKSKCPGVSQARTHKRRHTHFQSQVKKKATQNGCSFCFSLGSATSPKRLFHLETGMTNCMRIPASRHVLGHIIRVKKVWHLH